MGPTEFSIKREEIVVDVPGPLILRIYKLTNLEQFEISNYQKLQTNNLLISAFSGHLVVNARLQQLSYCVMLYIY